MLGSAKPGDEEIYERAYRILEKTGSHEKFNQYMKKKGLFVSTVQNTYTVPRPSTSDGEVGTQYLDKADLNTGLTLTAYSSTDTKYTATISWDWSRQDADDWGEPPKDLVGFFWRDNEWYVQGSEYDYIDKHVSFHSSKNDGDEGMVFDFNDSKGDGGDRHWASIEARYDAENVDSEKRQIFGKYVHTYDSFSYPEVSVGLPKGIDITSPSDVDGKTWTSEETEDDERLVVSPDNMVVT
ncbi:hypothetical protein [Halorussus sp. MSC15.2]|uniref:hypothetical protein n=1 Tax=Halorussus sp. MSC15.2 TaxID=2283638 RepID=UPI0013D8C917|nr:hypothetical protein [Halorussus sp. MSC15.2]NEU59070.1 hypothetical protein [Halorussus sp. MSC15.2]